MQEVLMRRIRRIRIAIGLAACLACASSDPAEVRAQAAPPAQGEEPGGVAYDPVLAELGEDHFQAYCASCHGMQGRGDGPTARALSTPPADLRRIAFRRGGVFPDAEIARKIDGRFEIDAHGTREMPVWGRVFAADVPETDTAESITRGMVSVLVEYLKSMQDPAGEPAHPAATRQTMGEIFEAMSVLLPLSLDGDRFEDATNEPAIRTALERLDLGSSQLERHGAGGDVAFSHLARSLSIDARDIRLRYAAGHRREARYLVQTLVETCVACHSRLPAASAPRSEAFAKSAAELHLDLEERAKLAYATRQFDVAEGLYEELLRSATPAGDIDLGGHLDDYLELEVRVRREYAKPARALEAFSRRTDLYPALKTDLTHWIAALNELAARKSQAPSLAEARELVAPHGETSEFVNERTELVEHLEASGILHRLLDTGISGSDRAEAYYLLGLIETRVGRSYWMSQAEAYLETAIRLAPGEPVAQRAYDLLDDYLTAGYSGSGGTFLPPDIADKLELLRGIAEAPAPAAKR
jgi:tetratricopeptide (TPR) repeat protein/mono/diheme cytochrome c family protein